MGKENFEIICAKDENAARIAAKNIINNSDLKEFEALCNKMDFLFDFVRENVYKRLTFAINKNNFKNIIKFFEIYSPYFDDFFSSILAKYADEDLTDEIYEILSNGTESQKTYAASYFKHIPDTVAIDELKNNLLTEFEPLFINCSMALGKMNDEESYQKYLSELKSDDDFVKLKAVKFLCSYGDNSCLNDLIISMQTSGMSENIAGEITNIISPLELLKKDFTKGAILLNNIINGLGEILPLENAFYYEIYDVIEFLFANTNKQETTILLLNLKSKFDIFTQNEEYIFDLDKNTKNEIYDIKNLLLSKDNNFWNSQKNNLKTLLKAENPLLTTVLNIIKEENIKECIDELISLTDLNNETILIEVLETIKELNAFDKIDKTRINFKNENLKAVFEQMFV